METRILTHATIEANPLFAGAPYLMSSVLDPETDFVVEDACYASSISPFFGENGFLNDGAP